jgi:hypothetical protein
MHKNATKCNKTLSKWCKNKHGASKIIDTFETYQYCVKDGDLYRCRPNGVTLKCISTHQGQELLRDIHADECGHHPSASTLAEKAYRSGFYWPSALWDAAEMVKRCEVCQFHAKQIHQPTQELPTIPLTWPFAV